MTAAPLKLSEPSKAGVATDASPRSHDRGPIEAIIRIVPRPINEILSAVT